VPLHQGRPITPEEFASLPAEEREQIERNGEQIQLRVADAMGELRALEKEAVERVRRLDREVAEFAIDPLLRELRDEFAEQPEVVGHIHALREDLLAHLQEFGGDETPQVPIALAGLGGAAAKPLDRYRVNVFVDNTGTHGAPVVIEREPTYYNLMGRIDYRSAFGTMVTNFREIKAGALHRANGGFLVLHAADVLRTPFAWDALKGALRGGEARIENLAAHLSVLPTATLRPQPIQLHLKVILIGTPYMYQLLCQYDDDFRELFKVRVDFAPDVDWDDGTVHGYARLVSRVVRDSGLRHFNAAAVARVVEHGARLREHQGKLTTRMADVADVVTEASHWAERRNAKLVGAADVERAIAQREYRSNLIEERVREVIAEGTLRIETTGSRVGQVNGVAVLDVGDHAFGRPSRITCRTSVGSGTVVSIEREIELSGPVHSKGVLTLAGYLRAAYAQEWPLAVAATVTFEQSYNEVDGDSASSTELYALLSALADLPIDQGIAVTGSVDQYGNVQAVGGVTTKVEGFFRVCRDAGLTGQQGVMIPAANVTSLMLDDEVVAAVRQRRFHLWAVHTIDEGIELLTGRRTGARRADGTFPPRSVHRLVEARLKAYAETSRAFGGRAGRARGTGALGS
jgi:predicted ATP-dependent protease